MRILHFPLFFMVLGLILHPQPSCAQGSQKSRLIVLTDIEADPDDTQSMVRLMLYSDEIDIEGLIATTSVWKPADVAPESIRKIVRAYGNVQPNLKLHEAGFPREIWSDAVDGYTLYVGGEYGRAVKLAQKTFRDNKVSLWRWRDEFQNDFAARMDWCTQPYKGANHAPIPVLSHPNAITVKSGEGFGLDASVSTDPEAGCDRRSDRTPSPVGNTTAGACLGNGANRIAKELL